ncbi:MAG: hypothetical protein AAGC60_15030 [Acidobacteriota bacterium]
MSISALRHWWQVLRGRRSDDRPLEADLPPSLWRPPHEDDIEPLADLPPELLRAGLVSLTRIHHAIADHHHRHSETQDHVYAAAVRCVEQRLLLTRDELVAARRIAERIERALDMAQRPRGAGARVAAQFACRSVDHHLAMGTADDSSTSTDIDSVDAEPGGTARGGEHRSARESAACPQRGPRLALMELGALR